MYRNCYNVHIHEDSEGCIRIALESQQAAGIYARADEHVGKDYFQEGWR
jgi:hypothetical protein